MGKIKNKSKKPSRSKLVKKLDNTFSKYVRYYYSDTGKTVKCYTCGERKPINKMQNGHFISRANYKYRRDINNCRPQCVACNIFKGGNYIEYTLKMEDELGRDKVVEMKNDKQIVKISTAEIQELIEKYTKLVDGYEKKQKLSLEKGK